MILLENYIPVLMANKSAGVQTNVPFTFGGTITFSGGRLDPVVDVTTATYSPTAAQSNATFLIDRAAGVTFTLPAPSAALIGLNYNFCVVTSVTSNNHKVITDASSTFILGGVTMVEAADTNSGLGALFNGTTHRAITMNGTTTGGLIGTFFSLTLVTATQWQIDGIVAGSGTLATPAATS